MNVLSYIHIHRLPNPSGVGRVIDRLLYAHTESFPSTRHRMLVDGQLYDQVYRELSDHWKTASFIPHRRKTTLQQALWVWRNRPTAEDYWPEVDVVYCPAESYVPVSRAKLVCTIHDVAGFEPDLYPDSRSQRLHRFKWSRLFGSMARHADAVITVSNFSAARIEHFFPDLADKLRVIYNAPHHLFGAPVDGTLEADVEKLTGGAPFVLVPGGLSLRKNASLILRAAPLLAEALPQVKLMVAGSSESGYVEQLTAACPDVILPGYVSDEMLNALYARATVVWFPSRYEGFGMPVIEAMAAGAPVVSSRAASIPEVAGDVALLCGVDEPGEHVEAIRSIVESPQLRQQLRERGPQQAGRFTWRKSAAALEELFQSL